MRTFKFYIDKMTALAIIIERKIDKLPRKNKEVHTVYSIAENRPVDILGKDSNGFYLQKKII